MPFAGDRTDANPIQWFRNEHWGKGHSSRLFYNEVPNTRWIRTGGHIEDKEKTLYSFTHADQDSLKFGIDTRTPEGREMFKKEYDALCEMAPELFKKEDL